MPDCLFCKIATHQIPVQAIHEDDHLLVFPDINPQAPTHWLVIPKNHTPDAAGTAAETLGQLLQTAAALGARHLPGGYRIVTNTGPDAGQSVAHLHLHLLGGRPMHWPPG